MKEQVRAIGPQRVTVPVQTWGGTWVIPHAEPEHRTRDDVVLRCANIAQESRCIHDPDSIHIDRRQLIWAEVPFAILFNNFLGTTHIAWSNPSDYDALHITCRMVQVPDEVWGVLGLNTALTVQKLMHNRNHIDFVLPSAPLCASLLNVEAALI